MKKVLMFFLIISFSLLKSEASAMKKGDWVDTIINVVSKVHPVTRYARTAYNAIKNDAYDRLQDGKWYLRDCGAEQNWNISQKKMANRMYKETEPWLHRSGSPDVFPGAGY